MKTLSIYLRAMFAVCLFAVAFVACSDDDEDGGNGLAGDATMIFTPQDMVSLADASDLKIGFKSAGEWAAKADKGWMHLSATSGNAGEQTLTLHLDENKGVEERTGVITLTDAVGTVATINVKQAGINELLVFFKDELVLEIDNGNQVISGSVDVLCNYPYSINIPDDAEWLNVSEPVVNDEEPNRSIITFTADVEKLNDFAEKVAEVEFAYEAPATRALPATKLYNVVFPGITPTLEFYKYDENKGEYAKVTAANLQDLYGDKSEYAVTLKVVSNFKWSLVTKDATATEEGDLDFEWFVVNGCDENGGNESLDFFSTENTLSLTLKNENREADTQNAELNFNIVKNGKVYDEVLNVKCDGVGMNYIAFNNADFDDIKDGNTMCGMFPGDGGEVNFPVSWGDPVYATSHEFTLSVANYDENIYFFAAEVINREVPTATEIDWVNVKEISEPATRALGIKKFKILVKNRTKDDYVDEHPTDYRFFALFAVPESAVICDDWGDPHFEQTLFSHTGVWGSGNSDILRPEVANNYIILGQYGLAIDYSFEVTSTDVNYNVGATGGVISFDFKSDAPSAEDAMFSWYYDVVGNVDDKREENAMGEYVSGWQGTPAYMNEAFIKANNFEFKDIKVEEIWDGTTIMTGTIEIAVPENTTGEERQLSVGLSSYASGNKLLFVQTITQSAN